MKALLFTFCVLLSLTSVLAVTLPGGVHSQNSCELRPLGPGRDDTDQVSDYSRYHFNAFSQGHLCRLRPPLQNAVIWERRLSLKDRTT